MMKEEVIVKMLPVKRIGEIIHFQVQLPNDIKKIIGIEYGTSGQTGDPSPYSYSAPGVNTEFAVVTNKVVGRLSLQNPGKEGFFYQVDLVEDRNAKSNEGIASALWQSLSWTHSRKREEVGLSVEGNISFIEGLFQDSWGKDEYYNLSYNLHLYLWIEKCNA